MIINHGDTYTFTVPPVAPTTTTDAGATEVTDCSNGYFVRAICSTGTVVPQFSYTIKCLAAGDRWDTSVSCS